MAKAVTKSVKKNVMCGVSLTAQELLEQLGDLAVFVSDAPEGEGCYFGECTSDLTMKVKVDGKEVALSKIEFIFTEKTNKETN